MIDRKDYERYVYHIMYCISKYKVPSQVITWDSLLHEKLSYKSEKYDISEHELLKLSKGKFNRATMKDLRRILEERYSSPTDFSYYDLGYKVIVTRASYYKYNWRHKRVDWKLEITNIYRRML